MVLGAENMTDTKPQALCPSAGQRACSHVLGGLTVDPGEHVAFFPAQVLADSVGGQSAGAPFVPA